MYTTLKCYDLFCEANPTAQLSYGKYWNIVKQINVSKHNPKINLCGVCVAFQNKEKTPESILEFGKHQAMKTTVRLKKTEAKNMAASSKNVICYVFDFQNILQYPKGEPSQFYYSRKLNAYNFTVYDMNPKDGFCYLWPEYIDGKF